MVVFGVRLSVRYEAYDIISIHKTNEGAVKFINNYIEETPENFRPDGNNHWSYLDRHITIEQIEVAE